MGLKPYEFDAVLATLLFAHGGSKQDALDHARWFRQSAERMHLEDTIEDMKEDMKRSGLAEGRG